MNECGTAIIIFTADEEFRDANGQVIFRPSENAIFELGAASAQCGSRVIIFKEVGVNFPTHFRDIGHIEFDKDRLDAKSKRAIPRTHWVQVNYCISAVAYKQVSRWHQERN